MKRKAEISRMNVVLCLLVIFIHVSSEPVSQLDRASWQYAAVMLPWRLSSFAVQGFLFLSGLKLTVNHPDGIDGKKYYLARVKSILIPYLLWVTVYYFYFIRIGYFGFALKDLLRYYVIGDLVSHFYYIVILVQFSILIPWLMRICRRWDAALILPLCAVATVIGIKGLPQMLAAFLPNHPFRYNDRIFTSYLVYWVGGMYAGLGYGKFCRLLRERFGSITALFAVLTVLESVFVYMSFTGRASVGILEELHVLYSMGAILFLFALCLRITTKRPLPAPVRELDNASYIVYLIHPLVIFVCNSIMTRAGVSALSTRYFIRIAFVYTVSIALSVLWKALVGAAARRKKT